MLSGQPLSRLQVVKGWLDADGQPQEAVLDLARAEKDAVLDPASCNSTPGGAATLCAQWEDPSWKAGETAWYYARALESPSCRWSQKLCVAAGVRCEDASSMPDGYESCCSPAHRPTVQERAWSSPIWVLPAAAPDA